MRTFLPAILLMIMLGFSCSMINTPNKENMDYRQEMRNFVQEISKHSKSNNSTFFVIPQNGHELLTKNDNPNQKYLNAIDALGQENLFYGYPSDDMPTNIIYTDQLLEQLYIGQQAGKAILITDYCSTPFKMSSSYTKNQSLGFISFAAPERSLTQIPDVPATLPGENANDISKITDAKNFLYLLNKEDFSTKEEFIQAIQNTNYDAFITDVFWKGTAFTPNDISRLKQKRNGGTRLLIAYMSIGEAEDYRYYWKDEWDTNQPDWMMEENASWPGNYKVKYWSDEWKSLIYGTNDSYLDIILSSGFDGVYLDIIDAFWYFENQNL